MSALTLHERSQALAGLAGWSHEPNRDAILRDFKFRDFVTAFSFMTAVAIEAEKANHHPEWSNVYDCVSILLTTHDVNGLSERDIALAHIISDLAVQIN
jgi:4a-hydroxytetrahydrobiopterin dehydratase